MAIICPFADWRPLPEATSQPAITPRVVIFHTAVGGLAGTEEHFRDNTGIESHFMVGGPTDGAALDGALWQWMDLGREADANLDANQFAISIETSDGGDPSRPWSAKQLATLVRVGNWLADRFNIPRRQCPAWDASGFGWHVMFGAPSHWTPVAKTCPGPVRIDQLRRIVLPAIFAGQQLQEDDMTDAEHAALMATKAAVDDILQALRVVDDGVSVNQDTAYQRVYNRTKDLAARPPAPTAAEVAAAVVAALPSGSVDAAVVQAAVETALNATVLQVTPA
jgi:hypothetical protein